MEANVQKLLEEYHVRAKAEFAAKIGLVLEEADESLFWLKSRQPVIWGRSLNVAGCRSKPTSSRLSSPHRTSPFESPSPEVHPECRALRVVSHPSIHLPSAICRLPCG